MNSLLCYLGLHRWRVLRVNEQRPTWLGSVFDPMDGLDADCLGCDKRIRDFDWQSSRRAQT
jgi:hypothetical protein